MKTINMKTLLEFGILLAFLIRCGYSSSVRDGENNKIIHFVTPKEVEAKVGTDLTIPCRFTAYTPFNKNHFKLEWGIGVGDDYCRPIYVLGGGKILHHPNLRAWMNIAKLEHGDCTLHIDAVTLEDNGVYELHHYMNDRRFFKFQQITVRITEQPVPQESIPFPIFPKEKETGSVNWFIQYIKRNRTFYAITSGLMLLGFLTGVAWVYGHRYCQAREKILDIEKADSEMEADNIPSLTMELQPSVKKKQFEEGMRRELMQLSALREAKVLKLGLDITKGYIYTILPSEPESQPPYTTVKTQGQRFAEGCAGIGCIPSWQKVPAEGNFPCYMGN